MGIRGFFLLFAVLVALPPSLASLASSWASSPGSTWSSSPVPASVSGGRTVEHLGAIDDGRFSRPEHAAVARAIFRNLDADRNGFVSPAELSAARKGERPSRQEKRNAAEKLAQVDRNGDALVSAREHADWATATFDRMDGDDDSFLSAEEIRSGQDGLARLNSGTFAETRPAG